MSPRRLTLIVNPISGTLGSKRGVLKMVSHRLRHTDFEVSAQYTRYPGHATDLAREAAERGDYGVIACGGDGTVNEVARALRHTPTALAILPAGSGNGLARHLDIPIDLERAVDVISRDHITHADYGTANATPFFCTCGVGFDAAVSERFARQRRRGLAMYLKSAIDEYIQYSPEEYIIETEGQILTERALLVVACNASQYGNNAYIAPSASVTDGLLDLTIVQAGSILTDAQAGLDLITGFVGRNARVHRLRTRSATIIRKSDGFGHIDGDPMMMPARIDIDCHAAALRIFTPPGDKERFRPLITPVLSVLRQIFRR